MNLIVASRKDEPSMKMAEKLMELYDFEEDTNGYKYKDFQLRFIDTLHIYTDFNGLDDDVSSVIFLSKHSSKANIKSLTVHPVGNLRKAELGGYDNVIVPSDPVNMSASLRYIKNNYNGNYFEVTFEATHHGPYLDKPAYFIEIGTTENEWNMVEIQELMAHAVIERKPENYKNYVGVGGGHYAPKISSYFFENKINIGHIIPKYVHEFITEEEIENTVIKTENCSGFYMDSHGTKGRVKTMVKSIADKRGLDIIYD